MSYKDTVLPIVKEVRNIVLPNYGCASIMQEKSNHPADVVTELDGKVEEFLKEKLLNEYSNKRQFVTSKIFSLSESAGGKKQRDIFCPLSFFSAIKLISIRARGKYF